MVIRRTGRGHRQRPTPPRAAGPEAHALPAPTCQRQSQGTPVFRHDPAVPGP